MHGVKTLVLRQAQDEGLGRFCTHNVIPVKTGIQQRAVLPAKDLFRTADAVHWIPACAGMTMGL